MEHAEVSAFSVATLKQAKQVCAAVNRDERSSCLSFSHLKEIVTRAPEAEIAAWQERAAEVSGYSVATLKTAKFVCQTVNRVNRINSLSFAHLSEIVRRAPEAEIAAWQERAVEVSGYSVVTLKKAKIVCMAVKQCSRLHSLSFAHLQEIVTRAPAPQARDAGVSGYSVATLKQAKQVCMVIKQSSRLNSLSFSHLQEIVQRAPAEQIAAWQERAAEVSGYSVATLKKAKVVCLRVEQVRRRNSLSYSHLEEIALRLERPEEIDAWQLRAEAEQMTRAALREQLRLSAAGGSAGKDERNDAAVAELREALP